MKALDKIEKFLLPFDRSSLHPPLNDPLYLQLKELPRNPVIRVLKGLFLSLFRRGYRVVTNERIVEIPFVYQNLDLPKKARILDFGCCESKVSIELASLGYNVTGTDINDYPFSHPNFRFVKGNFMNNAFEDGSFDAVVAISAVEHCGLPAYGSEEFTEGDRIVVLEMHRILTTGGRLFVTVPFGKRALIPGPCGQRIYDRDSLKALFNDKFAILKEEYFSGSDGNNWLPCSREDLSEVDSSPDGVARGVACIMAEKLQPEETES